MKPTKEMIEAGAKARWYFHEEEEGSWEKEPQEVREFELAASKAALEAAEAVRPSGWVKVKESYQPDGLVLLWESNGNTTFGYYTDDGYIDLQGKILNPIYWYALPEPPITD